MRRILAWPVIQGALAWLIWAYVTCVIATMRWDYENRSVVDAAVAGEGGVIALLWHGRIAQCLACRPLLRSKPRCVLVSLSRDGAFIALAAERLGIPTIRGSSGKDDNILGKGGAGAFRQAVRALREGAVVVITPDGPRGPGEVMATGVAQLALNAQAPVVLMGLAARPSVRLRSWDRGEIPLPFARGHLVVDGPLFAPPGMGAAHAEGIRLEWQARLQAAQQRAEARFDRPSRRGRRVA